ncbi:WD repeat-containing protein [Acrasis kona]|uniref:WD repeat-containing protein n=1 Tax=Acrasis kona TaxID=1008807 RepID=A0AAW2Z5T0_9EUKA
MRHKPMPIREETVQAHKQRDHYMEWRTFLLERKRYGQNLVSEHVMELFEEWKREKERDEIRENLRKTASPLERIGLTRSVSGTSLGSAALDSTSSYMRNMKSMSATETDFSHFDEDERTDRTEVDGMDAMEDDDEVTFNSVNNMAQVYAFVGMHHIFERGTGRTQGRVIKFGNNDNDILAFASSDGVISIATAMNKPEVIVELVGHTSQILDFDWSLSNEYLISVAHDKTIKVWNTNTAKCARTIPCKASPTCINFHPLNNNIFLSGFDNGTVTVYNLSTGKPADLKRKAQANTLKLSYPITALCITPLGDMAFVGDQKGFMYVYSIDSSSGLFLGRRIHMIKCSRGGPLTSISYSTYTSNSRRANPCLLVNSCGDDVVKLFGLNRKTGKIEIMGDYPVPHRKLNVRSVFCPLVSFRHGACFVSGSESTEVCVFDLARQTNSVNRLMGHSAAVLDVSWSYDEGLLASCDASGVIILWKRAPFDNEIQQRNIEEKQKREELARQQALLDQFNVQ